MNIPTLNEALHYLPDIALILTSGLAVLYCAMLSSRLKNLNNLKTGVGASILSLTQAIEETHKAAQDAQTSTLQAVETLRHLLEKSESAGPRVEALVMELERATDRANSQRQKLDETIDISAANAIEKAQTTTTNLLKIAHLVNQSKHGPLQPTAPKQPAKSNTLVELKTAKRSTS